MCAGVQAQAEEELLLPSSSEDEQEKSSPMRLVEGEQR
jgi:hypothetical protein